MAKVTGNFIKGWRKARGISAAKLGELMGYSRTYIKRIEGGSITATRRFARRFVALRDRTQTEEFRTRHIKSFFPLPKDIKILARPRRCRICREWFIFSSPNQRICTGRDCRREARRRA